MRTEIKNLLRRLDANQAEPLELLLLPDAVHAANDQETDIEYVRRLASVAEWFATDEFELADEPWPLQAARIVAGDFPPDKLPEHVREIARKLYYPKRTGAT